MGLSTANKIKFEYMLNGGPPAILKLYEASGQDYKEGMFVTNGSSGVERLATGAATGILGIACRNAQAATADLELETNVILATPETVFSAVCVHEAATASSKPDKTMLCGNYQLFTSSTANPHYISVDTTNFATTTLGGFVVGLKDATDVLYGRVYFVVNRVGVGPFFTSYLAT